MPRQVRAKQERVIEAVRHGFEGDAAVEFIHQNGFAMTTAGIARHLRHMGGRGRIQELIDAGKTNIEILEFCFPGEDLSGVQSEPPSQAELFEREETGRVASSVPLPVSFDTRKVSVRLPADLYEAVRFAAKAERKSQNDVIVDILTAALSRLPKVSQPEASEE